jgi:hypothetical protein
MTSFDPEDYSGAETMVDAEGNAYILDAPTCGKENLPANTPILTHFEFGAINTCKEAPSVTASWGFGNTCNYSPAPPKAIEWHFWWTKRDKDGQYIWKWEGSQ